MLVYLKRTAEVAVLAFIGGAVPSLLASDRLDRAAFAGAVSAGVMAVYALVVKRVGDPDRPSAL